MYLVALSLSEHFWEKKNRNKKKKGWEEGKKRKKKRVRKHSDIYII